MTDGTVTLVNAETGQSETIPVHMGMTTVQQVLDMAKALLGGEGSQLLRDGKPLSLLTATLDQAGVQSGDLLVLAAAAATTPTTTATAATTTTTASSGSGRGLDFSSLLAQAPAQTTTDSSNSSTSTPAPAPVYYPNMNLNEAMAYNPHPTAFVSLILQKEHLWKELHHHNPKVATTLKQQPSLQSAVQTWRNQVVQGAVTKAAAQTEAFHTERRMQQRLLHNPHDADATAYFSKQQHQAAIDAQFQQMMQEYPESMARVLMLYVKAKINGHALTAFCDSGAQSTIISKKLAAACGLLDLVDTRFAGTAVGVGTGKILGRIHLVQLELHNAQQQAYFFPCTVTVMDDPAPGGGGGTEMPFLLGLDMMKRHLCQIDLQHYVLRFQVDGNDARQQSMEVPFLHEKDLDQEQGGTRGFDAAAANARLLKEEEEDEDTPDKKENGNE